LADKARQGKAGKGEGGRVRMGGGAEQVLEGAGRRLAVEGLGGGRAGRELPTSCTGRPRTPWSTSMVPQAIRSVPKTNPVTDQGPPPTKQGLSTRGAAPSLVSPTMQIGVGRVVRESLCKRCAAQTARHILTPASWNTTPAENIGTSKKFHRARVSRPVLELRSGCTLASASSEPPTREGATTISSDAARLLEIWVWMVQR